MLYLLIRKYIKFRKRVVEQEELLNEVADLQESVKKLQQEKDDIMAMKVSQLGLGPNDKASDNKPGSSLSTETNEEGDEDENAIETFIRKNSGRAE